MKKLNILALIIFTMLAGTAMGQNLVDIQEAAAKIREKEKELNEREQGLNAREQRLNVLEKDLIAREDELRGMRSEIEKRLADLNGAYENDLEIVAQIYSSTKAKQAAAVIVKMDLVRAASLIRRIGPREAGKLMAEMAKLDADYAAKLTTLMSGDNVTLEDISRAIIPDEQAK